MQCHLELERANGDRGGRSAGGLNELAAIEIRGFARDFRAADVRRAFDQHMAIIRAVRGGPRRNTEESAGGDAPFAAPSRLLPIDAPTSQLLLMPRTAGRLHATA